MIEETARVITTEGELAWVEAVERKTSCGHCVARGSCGTSVLAKILGRRALTLAAHNPIGAQPGDRVILGLRDEALVRGSFAVYLVPLLAMLAAALLAESVAPAREPVIALSGLIGLMAGFGGVHLFGRHAAADPRYRPVILRQDAVESVPVQFER